ncbi:ABC transporter permease [Danxiaibacter flavus]|uniref:ABC transporter permease n=1 Tax=Danxiaibacter flavus TaxID=3049108 RepID=A0ABV3ZAA1_9BACT|nr:ABC transporter permease [Chitinophagaceae bacterium DXS]
MYFKTIWRRLIRNKAFSFINIFGLAIGLTSCLLIVMYILDESSYDQHHKDGDRLFRIALVSNKVETWAAAAAPLAFTVKSNLPEIEQSARLMTFPDIAKMLIRNKNTSDQKQFFETNGYYVDSTFFQLFTYNFVYGNGMAALNAPNTMVISKEMSERFFGKENPVNKPLSVNTPFGEFNYTVKAVFDNSTYKSHIPANYFLSMRNQDMWNWVTQQTNLVSNNVFYTYIKLKSQVDAKQFGTKLNTFFDKQAGEEMKTFGFKNTLFLQPVKDIYLHSAIGNEIRPNGAITYLYILGSIAAFILVIACINFMNLSTARSEKRAREVAVKKVIGAGRRLLVWQLLGESFIMCIAALVIAIAFTSILLPYFNALTHKNIRLADEPRLIVWIAIITLATGLFAGIYPAFYLSSFKPVQILKGKIINSFSATALRKGLVVFQFAISVCLVIAAVVIWKQLNYLDHQQLGFNTEQKLVLPLQDGYLNSESNYTALKNELLQQPEVKAVTCGSAYPGIVNLNDMLFFAEGKAKDDNVDVHTASIGENYIETMGFQLLSGRSFSKDFTADSLSIILNETAVKQLGYTAENAIGRKANYNIGKYHGALQIVGVVKDFNFESLHNHIEPYGFTTTTFGSRFGYLIANLNTKDYARAINKIEHVWTKLNPTVPFRYSFVDKDFQHNYEKEQLTSRLVTYFTIIAILIACLGLFGLSIFAAEQKRKEVGIRKVLGASAGQISLLLSKEFITLVVVGVVIASPVAWLIMNKWLQGFAYRTSISWWMFAVAGLSAVCIAFFTISFQSIKAALANPVKSLRTE